jgi:purine-nucleoside phosphorylase
MNYYDLVRSAADRLREKLENRNPQIGIILGSGLGDFANQVKDAVYVPYQELPFFPVSTVEGHAGQFVIGDVEGKCVIIMQGRVHFYEGYTMRDVVFPVYVMKSIGIGSLIITNAAGGMNPDFSAGDFMLIQDHINVTGDNPLIGIDEKDWNSRFIDMSVAYDREYQELMRNVAMALKSEYRLVEGVYCGISGPAYLTPSELKWLAKIGGDAIGMSTVGEAIAARHAGIRIVGISCITDMAIGETLEPLSHEQVVAVANQTKPYFYLLIKHFLREVKV